MNEQRKGDWLQTASGKAFYPADPRPEDINIHDIAHALAHLCRFGGHSRHFYSVAEHSVLVSQCVPAPWALEALLHDATEAYVVDVPRPVKRALGESYARLEAGVWAAIAKRFNLPEEMPACVKEADNAVLMAERAALLDHVPGWGHGLEHVQPAPVTINCMSSGRAKRFFLSRFSDLLYQREKAAACAA